ncbi:MAG: S8 family serine peptidase [Halothiobacillaceae bacterium]|nr:MAG: S8 family serine peptidase [Halothiobacillaceae bacterium]
MNIIHPRWGSLLASLAILAFASAQAAPVTGADPEPSTIPKRLADLDGNRLSDGLQAMLETARPQDLLDVVVTFRGPVDIAAARQVVGPFRVKRDFRIIPGFAASMTAAQVRGLMHTPGLFRIEEDFRVRAILDAADHDFGTAAARAEYGLDGGGIGVCVIDTGVDPKHEQLDSRIAGFLDVINGRNSAYDDQGHGTHVASIVAGDGVGGPDAATFHGVAPGAAIYAAKVLDAQGSGTESQVIAGIEWCAGQGGVHVLSMSLGSGQGSDGQDALSQAVNAAVIAHGKVAAAAAGNEGDAVQTVGSPGAAAQAITVAAAAEWSAPVGSTRHSDGIYLAPFSSRGPTLDGRQKPDITAPGVSVMAAKAGTTAGYVAYSGTSMATPFVAGTLALALDAKLGGVMPTASELKSALYQSARDRGPAGLDHQWGAGLLDGQALVGAVLGDPPASPTDFPMHRHIEGTVARNGLYSYPFEVADTSTPVAATLLINGQASCSWELFGSCLIWEWSPDLEARLRGPDGTIVASSECPAYGDCGSMGQQETLHYMPAKAGAHTLEVYPFAGSPNNGMGGSFVADISSGPVGGAPINRAPLANPDGYAVNEDMTLTVAAPGVLANDSDPDGDALTAVLASGPAHGSLSLNAGGGFTYTPVANWYGTDSFGYRASDGIVPSGVATVTLTVHPVNDAPVAVGDAASTPAGTAVDIAVLANDSDPEGAVLSVGGITQPDNGSVTHLGASVRYTPNAGFSGSDSFTYWANDGVLDSAPATVALTVNPASTATTVHIADLDGSSLWVNSRFWRASVTVTVHDDTGNPVAGATVGGKWGKKGSSCLTGEGGTCTVTSGNLGVKTASATFTVTGIAHTTLGYAASDNTDPDGDSTGTSITVAQP